MHDGTFHADEVLAIALLCIVFEESEISITRGRDMSSETFDIVVDTNLKYDGVRLFDHHQFDKNSEYYGLSSAGLVNKALINGTLYGDIGIDRNILLCELVSIIDEHDVGIKSHYDNYIIKTIESINEASDKYSKRQYGNFLLSVDFVTRFVKKLLMNEYKTLEEAYVDIDSNDKVIRKMNKRIEHIQIEKNKQNEKVIEIVNNLPVITVSDVRFIVVPRNETKVHESFCVGKCDFVVNYNDNKNAWVVKQVPIKVRYFGGNFDLDPAIEFEGNEFTHKAGFYGVYKTNSYLLDIPVVGKGILKIDILHNVDYI